MTNNVSDYINAKVCARCGMKIVAADPVFPELCNTCCSKIDFEDYHDRLKQIIRRS